MAAAVRAQTERPARPGIGSPSRAALRAALTLVYGRSEPEGPRLPYERPMPPGRRYAIDAVIALVALGLWLLSSGIGPLAALHRRGLSAVISVFGLHIWLGGIPLGRPPGGLPGSSPGDGLLVEQLPALLIALVSAAAIAGRNRWPLGAWRATVAALLALGVAVVAGLRQDLDNTATFAAFAYLLCCYAVAVRNAWRVAIAVWAATVLLMGLLVGAMLWALGTRVTVHALPALHNPLQIGFIMVLMTAVVLLFGANRRADRQARLDLMASAEQNAQERTARALAEERSRIARELHDVAAHHMSVIAIQAEAAPLRHGDDNKALIADLAEIRAAALAALRETRRILSVLHPNGERPDTGPQPDLGRIDELIANAKAAGHEVTLTIKGTPAPLQPGVALSAYRIVQESLSNVIRHAPGAAVAVDLVYEPDRLVLRVVNGPATKARTPGLDLAAGSAQPRGLVGMRERAAMLHGTLEAGPTADGGFQVVANLPVGTP